MALPLREMGEVLVTGATGFVGRAVCRAMAKNGIVARRAVRSPDAACLGDIVIPDLTTCVYDTSHLAGITGVIHLASRVHVMRETEPDPELAYRRMNVEATERLAQAAAQAGARRFVFVSSIKVNGEANASGADGKPIPFGGADEAGPQDAYGRSKWDAERSLRRIGERTGMEIVVIRPPLVYGPQVRGNFLRLMQIIARGTPLPLGLVDNRRSLVYVESLASAILATLDHPRAAGKTYLVSDGEALSTPELIQRLARHMKTKARLFSVPPPLLRFAGKCTGKTAALDRLLGSLVVDSRPLGEELGWRPPFSSDEGLCHTAEWFRSGAQDSVSRQAWNIKTAQSEC